MSSVTRKILLVLCTLSLPLWLSACGGGGSSNNAPAPVATPPPPQSIAVSGAINDGPVIGGTLFVFTADTVLAALTAAAAADDRAAALSGANPLVTVARSAADGGSYELVIPGDAANAALFFVFDADGAEDETFGDQPFNLFTVVQAGSGGGSQTVNLTPHTTLAALATIDDVDPDGNGTPASAADIASAAQAALASALAALGTDDEGNALFPDGEDPVTTTDEELLTSASSEVGLLVRTLAVLFDTDANTVVAALAADAADGAVDGTAASDVVVDDAAAALVAGLPAVANLGRDTDTSSAGPCTGAARALRQACSFDALDDLFTGRANCVDTSDQEAADDCLADVAEEHAETLEECADVTEARLELCENLDERAHDPAFGEAFADNFVDPQLIGVSVDPHPFFPLQQGNRWVYSGTSEDDDGEEVTEVITVTVTDRTKLIDGVTCLVVNDRVEEDGVLIEDTDDWFAQDTDGNLWYCGEIAENFESFDGDNPETPELVDIEGSWKHGRDGSEAGILIPAVPTVAAYVRQEVAYGDAEDAIEIQSVTGTEQSPGATCDATCLVTRDFTPLEPDANELKYFAPGVGLIVEVDLDSDERVELQSFTPGGTE